MRDVTDLSNKERLFQRGRYNNGIVTLQDALDEGLTEHQLRHLVRSGKLERYNGCYRIPGSPETFWQDMHALTSGTAGVDSHRAAGAGWGFDGCIPKELEITVTSSSIPRVHFDRRVVIHRTRYLPDEDVMIHRGVPLTVPARTLLDLGGSMPRKWVRRAALSALDRNIVHPGELHDQLERYGRQGRPGTRTFRKLLAEIEREEVFTDSDLEDDALHLLEKECFPRPVIHYKVRRGGVLLGEVDLAYPELGLGIEVDGYEFHSSKAAFFKDRSRLNSLFGAGWRIVFFTYSDAQHPLRFLTELRRVYAA